jgi:hypothetical protein
MTIEIVKWIALMGLLVMEAVIIIMIGVLVVEAVISIIKDFK